MPLDAGTKDELRELFVLFDRDLDGSLSPEEFATVRSHARHLPSPPTNLDESIDLIYRFHILSISRPTGL